MCDPISAIATAAVIGSSILGVQGAAMEGEAAAGAASYNRQVALNNAQIAENQAKDALDRGRVEETIQRQRMRLMLGAAREDAASRGVLVDTGSAADVFETVQRSELYDALTIRRNAEREAASYRNRAADFRSEAELARQQGRYARRGARFKQAGSLLGGATTIASRFYR